MRKLTILFTAYMIYGLNLCHSQKQDDSRLYPYGGDKQSGHCRRELDLTLLVDESSSIQTGEWTKLIIFLKSLIRSINIAPNYAHISLITFSTSTRSLITFTDPASKDEGAALKIVDLLGKSKPAIGLTYTGPALEYIRNSVLHFGTRQTAPKAIILITDGESTQPGLTYQESAMLRDEGVTMLVVGVKSAIGYECRSVVGCPERKVDCPAFFMTKWDDIIKKVGNLMTEVCETIPKDAVCKPIWSDWSPCNVKCGPGTKFKKLMDIITVEEQTVGTNGKPGKTCKEQFVNVEQPQEECMGPCTDKTHIENPGEFQKTNRLTLEQHQEPEDQEKPGEEEPSDKGDETPKDEEVAPEGDEDPTPENTGEGESDEGVTDVYNPVPEEVSNEPEESPEEAPGEESEDEPSDEAEGGESVEDEEASSEGENEESDEETSAHKTHEGEQSPEENSHEDETPEENSVPGEHTSQGDHLAHGGHEAVVGDHQPYANEEGELGGDHEEYAEEGDGETTDGQEEELPGVSPHSQCPNHETPAGDHTKHESSHQSSQEEKSTKKEEFSRSGAMIAGGIILGLLMIGAGGGYTYYRKRQKVPDVESGFGNDGTFGEATGAHHSQEGETYSVADLDDGLWSEAH